VLRACSSRCWQLHSSAGSILLLLGMHTALPILLIRSGTDAEAFAFHCQDRLTFLPIIGGSWRSGLTLLILKFGLIEGLAAAPIATATICNAAAVVFGISERGFSSSRPNCAIQCSQHGGDLNQLGRHLFFSLYARNGRGICVVAYYLGMLLSRPCCNILGGSSAQSCGEPVAGRV